MRMRFLRPTPGDALTFLFAGFLLAVTLAFPDRINGWRDAVVLYGALLAAAGGVVLLGRRPGAGALWVRLADFAPFVFVPWIFSSLGHVVHVLHLQDRDAWLIAWDHALFGVHPTVWMERWIRPWLTDLLQLAYTSYFFLPLILGTALYFRGKRDAYHEAVFTVLLGFYASFAGYLLIPAVGPRFTLAHLQTVPLDGSPLTQAIRETLDWLENNKRDVFPSGHTAIVILVLVLAYRFERRLFYPFLPLVLALVVSTVYLRYHYVVDVIAGILLAGAVLAVSPGLYRWGLKTIRGPASRSPRSRPGPPDCRSPEAGATPPGSP